MCKKCGHNTKLYAQWGTTFIPCACKKDINKEIDQALKTLERKLVEMNVRNIEEICS